MESPNKGKLIIIKFWTGLLNLGRLLPEWGRRLLSIFPIIHATMKKNYRRLPRILQLGSIYLFVILLAGALFIWRSAQLRTINPYIDRIKFAEPAEMLPPEKLEGEDGMPVQDEPDIPATAEHSLARPEPEKEPDGPEPAWPVHGRETYQGYHAFYNEDLTCLSQGGSYSFYRGIAVRADEGERVCSIADGEVLRVNDRGRPYYGKEVIIQHGGNLKVYYGALDQVYVKEGQLVSCGEPIATVKKNPEDGHSYVYLEMKEKGTLIDPMSVLP